jgi:hypothetical protein
LSGVCQGVDLDVFAAGQGRRMPGDERAVCLTPMPLKILLGQGRKPSKDRDKSDHNRSFLEEPLGMRTLT